MTDFILRDGTVVERRQEYEIDLLTGTFVLLIGALDSRKELLIFSIEGLIRDMKWSAFSIGYDNGMIRRHNEGEPRRSLSPHTFI